MSGDIMYVAKPKMWGQTIENGVGTAGSAGATGAFSASIGVRQGSVDEDYELERNTLT
jgi:hypothetical protein